ncbi:tautomerase family protein [Kiloniella laminariae]|uniref:Tautomerase family protein n=1 Tax=Kiloniella laminariae TaxID=454162 RepID=A0ABT4LEE8_9PROT|nr:tautomerase family protein [Kiloniella laminariae]MCZ4279471.1 tautomerase family protein [Kiloniella laminariae]
MPLVRISHSQGRSQADRDALSQAVHQALVSAFAVPQDDYFQILTEHLPNQGLRFPKNFLGIEHGEEMIFVQITAAEGRSSEQKKSLFQGIVDRLNISLGLRKEDIFINLIETKRENWSFGRGEMPFA